MPKTLLIDRYFSAEKKAIEKLESDKETILSQLTEMEEEHSSEDGFFAESRWRGHPIRAFIGIENILFSIPMKLQIKKFENNGKVRV